jgi:hypothetical protein
MLYNQWGEHATANGALYEIWIAACGCMQQAVDISLATTGRYPKAARVWLKIGTACNGSGFPTERGRCLCVNPLCIAFVPLLFGQR